MSYIPPDFASRLKRDFDGRLRIRWSDQRAAYQIEVQCGRKNYDIPLHNPQDDDCIRARDGYARVMEVQPRQTFECPARVSQEYGAQRCGVKLQIPLRERVEVTCVNCQQHGRDGRTRAEYWPLDDRLLDRLKQIDPMRKWAHSAVLEMDLENKRNELRAELDVMNDIDALNFDFYNRLAGIQSVGYTGRERAWIR